MSATTWRFHDIPAGLQINRERKEAAATAAVHGREDILDEKVMSCILEFKIDIENMPEVLKAIENEVKRLDTVVAMGIAIRCDSKGDDTVRGQLEALGFDAWRAKINMGLGRHTNPAPARGEATL